MNKTAPAKKASIKTPPAKAAPTPKAAVKVAPVKASVKTPPAKEVPKRAQEELRVSEERPGEWAWSMYRGGRFVARGEHYSKKGNAARAAEKFNALLAVPMNVVA